MPEYTAVLNISAHGINDAEADQLVEMMDEHEFWYWDEAEMVGEYDGIVITSEAFADTDENSAQLEGRVKLEDEAVEVRVLYAQIRPPRQRYRLDRLVVCGAPSDSPLGD